MSRRVSNLKASSLDKPLNHRLRTAPTHPIVTRWSARVYKWPHSFRCQHQRPSAPPFRSTLRFVPFLSPIFKIRAKCSFLFAESNKTLGNNACLHARLNFHHFLVIVSMFRSDSVSSNLFLNPIGRLKLQLIRTLEVLRSCWYIVTDDVITCKYIIV
jgi:hypothetical protein